MALNVVCKKLYTWKCAPLSEQTYRSLKYPAWYFETHWKSIPFNNEFSNLKAIYFYDFLSTMSHWSSPHPVSISVTICTSASINHKWPGWSSGYTLGCWWKGSGVQYLIAWAYLKFKSRASSLAVKKCWLRMYWISTNCDCMQYSWYLWFRTLAFTVSYGFGASKIEPLCSPAGCKRRLM